MNDLTEQWKKGDLKSGWYYTRLKEGTFAEGIKPIEINYFYEFNKTFESHNDFVEEVLAEVPTYRNLSKSCEVHIDDCKILAKKLLEAKPELEDWIKKNFGEYL